jgi:predicted nucleic acid-binding Zn ribbon protein
MVPGVRILVMADEQPLFKIKTPYRKCRHCGHRVVNPNDTVCTNCYVPEGHADRAVSTAIVWTGVGALVIVFLFLWPSIREIVMEIID